MKSTSCLRSLALAVGVFAFASGCSSSEVAIDKTAGGAVIECFPGSVLVASTDAAIDRVTVTSAEGTADARDIDDYVYEIEATDISEVVVVATDGRQSSYDCRSERDDLDDFGNVPERLAFADDGVRVVCTEFGATITASGAPIEQVIAVTNGSERTIDHVDAMELLIDDPAVARVMVVAGDEEGFGGFAARHDCIRSVGVFSGAGGHRQTPGN